MHLTHYIQYLLSFFQVPSLCQIQSTSVRKFASLDEPSDSVFFVLRQLCTAGNVLVSVVVRPVLLRITFSPSFVCLDTVGLFVFVQCVPVHGLIDSHMCVGSD